MSNPAGTRIGKSDQTLDKLRDLGWTSTYVPDYPLSKLSPKHRVQVRSAQPEGLWAPVANIRRIADAMESIDFNPILVTRDGWTGDGNTRIGAALKNKRITIPAHVLDFDYDGCGDRKRQQLQVLGASLNSSSFAVPLPPKDLRLRTQDALRLGYKFETIKGMFHLRDRQLTELRKEVNAADRLKEIGGVDPNLLSSAALKALGSSASLTLHAEPYRSLAQLAADAGLGVAEINTIVGDVRALDSDLTQVDALDRERDSRSEEITLRRLYGKTNGIPASRTLRQHLGFVTKYHGREHELIEKNPGLQDAQVEILRTSVAVLSAVLEMQQGS